MLRYIVGRSIGGLSKEADYEAVEKFFADKDTSKYAMVLAQTQESIRAKITWIKVRPAEISYTVYTETLGSAQLVIFAHGWRIGRRTRSSKGINRGVSFSDC